MLVSSRPVSRTGHISWAPSGWLVSGTTAGVDTDFLTLTCPDDFVAIRVGFTNINSEPCQVTKVIAAASRTLGDFANPVGDATWTALTFANRGASLNNIINCGDAPTTITVAGNDDQRATGGERASSLDLVGLDTSTERSTDRHTRRAARINDSGAVAYRVSPHPAQWWVFGVPYQSGHEFWVRLRSRSCSSGHGDGSSGDICPGRLYRPFKSTCFVRTIFDCK